MFNKSENQASGETKSEARGENSNKRTTETILLGQLHVAGKETNDAQFTDPANSRHEIKVPPRDVDCDGAAIQACIAQKNEAAETSKQTKVKQQLPVEKKIRFEQKLPAWLESDNDECLITGMVMLSGNRLVLADHNNKVIKLMDTSAGRITSQTSVEDHPWDVTVVSHDRLAVTVCGDPGKIQFVSVSGDRLSAEGYLPVSPGCRGIACHGDRLYVSYISDPKQVQVLDLHGLVLQTFVLGADGQPLFDFPEYITVSNDGSMYISDKDKDTLTCLDPQGQVQWCYQNAKLKRPAGIVVDTHGTVYVAGYRSRNIHVVSPNGNQLHVLRDEGIAYPQCLIFNGDGDRLFVGAVWWNDYVLVYRLKLTDDL